MTAVLVSQSKYYHKGFLCGHISNGNGVISLGNGFAIKIVASKDYAQINLLHYGNGNEIPIQSWQKSVKIIEKPKKEDSKQVELKEEVSDEAVI